MKFQKFSLWWKTWNETWKIWVQRKNFGKKNQPFFFGKPSSEEFFHLKKLGQRNLRESKSLNDFLKNFCDHRDWKNSPVLEIKDKNEKKTHFFPSEMWLFFYWFLTKFETWTFGKNQSAIMIWVVLTDNFFQMRLRGIHFGMTEDFIEKTQLCGL